MIKKIINELDTVLAQVLIDAIVMEVTLDKSLNVGVSYVQNQPSAARQLFQRHRRHQQRHLPEFHQLCSIRAPMGSRLARWLQLSGAVRQ